MMKLLKKRIFSRKGFSYIMASVMIFVTMLIGAAIFEIIRLNIQAAAVRDKFEDAIISMCVENYAQLYQSIREGHAASYGYNGMSWAENNNANTEYIQSYLNTAMNSGEIMQCDIESMTYNVEPGVLAPSDAGTADKFSVTGTIVINIPYRFAWSDLQPVTMQLDVKSQWRAKF